MTRSTLRLDELITMIVVADTFMTSQAHRIFGMNEAGKQLDESIGICIWEEYCLESIAESC